MEDGARVCASLSDPIRLAHVGVLESSIVFRLVAVKPLVLDWSERTVTVRRGHDRFREDPVRLVTGVTKVRVPVIVRRTDGTDEGIISISESMFVFLLACRTPNGIKDVLTFRRWSRSKVGPNGAALGPHYWLVVFRAPFGRGRQRSFRGNRLEGNTSRFRVPCTADSSFGEVLLT